jgi:Flp pilus assembly pilin Flp
MHRPYHWLVAIVAYARDQITDAHRRGLLGQQLTEYALIIACGAIVAIVVLTMLGNNIQNTLLSINDCFPPSATPGSCPTPAP